MDWNLRIKADIAQELHKLNENISEQNRLIAEILKYLLRNEQ